MLFANWLSRLSARSRRRHRRSRDARSELLRQIGPTEALETRTMLTAPVATEDFFIATDYGSISPTAPGVLGNDTDSDGDPLTAVLDTDVTMGSLTLNTDGSFSYTASAGMATDSFTYTASDGVESSAATTVTIDIGDVPGDDIWSSRSVALNYGQKREVGGLIGDGMNMSLDVDLFSVTLNAGDHLLIDIDADELDDGTPFSDLDSYLRVFDDMGVELASNDDAPDPDTLVNQLDSALTFSTASSGTFHIGVSGYGNFTYDPTFGGSGVAASEGEYRLQLTRTANGSPVANPDSVSTGLDTSIGISVLSNDSDPDGDALALESIGQPSSGATSIEPDGVTVTYQPNTGFTGTDSFTYTVEDPYGAQSVGTVTVTVGGGGGGGGNSSPNAVADSVTVDEDSNGNVVSVLSNDTDPDGDTLTITSVGSASNGTAALQSSSVTYTPDSGFVGQDSFTYSISDGNGGSATGQVTVTVSAAGGGNQAPTANDETVSMPTDSSEVTISVLSNDTDPDGDPLSISQITTWPQSGSAWIDNSGPGPDTIQYQPNPGFTGTDTLVYEVSDPDGLTDTATLTLNVGLNNAPTGTADSYSATSGHALAVSASGVLGNDSDPDGDSITAVLEAGPSDGSLTLNSDGSFTFTPDVTFSGTDSFTYRISDGSLTSSPVTVSIDVTLNQTPATTPDSYAAVSGQPLTVSTSSGLLANDADADGHTLTAALVTSPSDGTVTVNSDGSLTYTSNAGFIGTDTFTYKASDGAADSSDTTVTVNVYGGPIWAVSDSYTIGHDRTLNVAASGVLKNDWDQEGDILTTSLVSSTVNGLLTLHANGAFVYTPDAGFTGTDSFDYTVTDGTNVSNTATVTIDVTNHAPVAVDDFFLVPAGIAITASSISLTSNDWDWEKDTLTVTLEQGVSNGSLTLNPDGTFTYTPDAGFLGTDFFSYRAHDAMATGSVATVTLNVENADPNSNADRYRIAVDSTLTVAAADGVLSNDSDREGQSLSAALAAGPTSGSVNVNADGSFDYTPNPGFIGSDSFTYTVTDSLGGSSTGTVNIDVTNRVPIPADDYFSLSRNTTLTSVTVVSNDWDSDGHTLSVPEFTQPTDGTLTLNSDGTFTYMPDTNFVGTDGFTYRVSDAYSDGEWAAVTIDVTNGAPVALEDGYTTHQGVTLTTNAGTSLVANDLEPDGESVTSILVDDVTDGSLTFQSDGTFTYVPDSGFSGEDSFTYKVSDGLLESDPVTVTITVQNALPGAVEDGYVLSHDTTLTVNAVDGVLSNDIDVDSDPLTAELVSDVASGMLALSSDGSFTYTPNAGFVGSDSFTYRTLDGAGESETVTVTLAVENSDVVGTDRSYSIHQGQTLIVAAAEGLLKHASDADGDTIAITVTDSTDSGTLTTQADGSLTYVPNAGFSGQDTATFTLSDGVTVSGTFTLSIDVTNTQPTVLPDRYELSHDQALTVSGTGVLANDSDADLDSLTVSLVTTVTQGTLTLNANGTFTYTPADDFTGSDSFEYVVSDGAATVNGLVTLVVSNTAPDAQSDSYGTRVDQTLTVNAADGILANDSDDDGDSLTVSLIDGPDSGTLTLNGDGSFQYIPATGFLGRDQFRYQLNDGLADSVIRTARIGVFATSLESVDDSAVVSHDQSLSIPVQENDFNENAATVTVVLDSAPTNGTATVETDGTVTYVPNAGYTGSDAFRYHLDTGTATTATTTVSISVVNSTPVAFQRRFDGVHDAALSISAADGLLSDYRDDDGDAVTAALDTAPTYGSVAVQANGSFIYTPNAGFIGTDVFTYTLSDGLSTTAPISVEIEVENQAPGGWDDSLSLHAGTTATGNVLVNDRDADGDALTASLVTDVQHGSLTLGSDGAFTYTPTASYVGSDSFVYKASDGLADSSSVTVTLSVTNTAPSAYDDRFVVTHDAVLNDTTVSNDRDWDGDSLTASLITAPTNGQLTLNADGTFAFTPDAGFTGSDSFQYRLADSWANGNTATATIQVTNQSPVALDELVTLFRGEEYVVSTTDLLANDSDGDGDSLTVTLVDLPQEGTFASNPDGTWTYTPDGDFAGTDTLTYRVNDGIEDSTLATVTIDVLNREPSAADDSFDVVHDQSIAAGAVSIFDNDIDLDGDSLSAELVTGTSYGSLTLNADGTFAYTANAGFVGQDEFRYRVTDGIAHSEPVVVTINIDNSEPVAVEDRLRVIHDQTLTVPVESGLISSAIDADGDSLTVTVLAQPLSGQLNVAADGSFTYEPDAGFAGTDSFIYRVSDGVSDSPAALVTIDVQNTPVSVAGDVIAVEPDQATVTFLATDLLENDVDFEGDSLTVALVTPPPRGTLTLSGNTFTYTRDGSYSGDVAFTYSVSDGVSTSYGTAVLMFSGTLSGGAATGTGADPIAGDDLYTVDRNGILDVGYAGGLLRNDFDPNGDDLSTVQENGPANGTLTLTGDGEFVYTPNLGFVGTDSFTYHVTDGTESSPGVARISNSATVSITVTNTAPTAGAKTYTTHHGVELSSANDGLDHVVSDAEGDTLTFSLVSDVSDGTLTFNAGGSFDYTPDAGFVGTDSFTYKVSDGALESGTATVTIDVTNTIPVARTQYYRGHQGEAITVPASGVLTLASDFDADVLTAVLESGPASGTLTLNSDGSFTYTPNAGFVGADTFRFRANDGAEDSSPATVTLDVRNEAPDALDSSHSVHQGDTLTIDPRAWDADADDLEFEILTTPSSGTLTYDTISGTNPRTLGPLTYEVPNAVVTDTLTFRAWDGAEWSAPATVTIDVTNIRPDAIPATRVIRPNDSVGISLLPVYASDADGDDITVVSPGTVTTALGQYTLTANGTFTFDSNGTVGDEIVPFSVTDLAEVSDPQNITVRVVNTPPVALDHIYHFHHADHPEIWMTNEGPYAIDLATGPRAAHDADSDPLTFELVATSNGTATLTPDGQLFFTPPFEGFIGTVSIQYRVNDGYTDSPTGTVTLEFTNNAPVSLDDYLTTPHGQSLVITQDDLTNNDRDVNVDQLDWDVDVSSLTVVSTVTGAGPGTLTPNLDSNGVLLSYTYSPPVDPDFVGVTKFKYRLHDGAEYGNYGWVYIDVGNVKPWAVGESWVGKVGEFLSVPSLADRGDGWDLDSDDLTAEIVGAEPKNLTFNSDGSYTYTYINGHEEFTFRVFDGAEWSDPIPVHLQGYQSALNVDTPDVDNVNKAPVATDDGIYYANRNQTIHGAIPSLLFNDIDPDGDPLQFTSTVLSGTGPGGSAVTLDLNDTTGPLGFTGGEPGTYTYTYTITDGEFDSTANLTIVVVNNAPYSDDYYVTTPIRTGTEYTTEAEVAGVMITDADFDYATLLSSPSVTGGTTAMVDITPAGDPAPTFEFSYTPNIGFSGIETAEWQFTDGLDVGVIRVHVAVTDDPNFDWNVIETNPIEVPWQSGTRQFNALGGASSIEAFDLDIDSFVSVPGLTLIDAETGTFEFTPPDPDAFVAAGGTSFTYTAIDTAGNTATGSVSIVPQIVDLPPTGTAYTNGIGKYYFWESSAGHWKATAVEGHTFTVDAGAHDLTWVGPGDWISAISDGHVALDPPPPSGVGHLTVTAASLGDTKTKSLYATTSGAVGDVDTEILRRVDADSIGGVTVSKDLYHLESNDSIGTVVVSGDSQTIIAGTISENITTQGLYTLSVAGDISGNVSASDIGHTYISGFNDLGASYGHSGVNSQNGRISGDFSSGRHIGYVKAELNLDGDITASGNISEIRSRTADITSIITQSGDPTDAIHLIDADRHFTGEVVANQLVLLTAGLDISRPEVSNIGDSDIAAYVIGTVRAGRDIVEVDFDASNAIQLIQAGDWSTGTTGHFVSGSIETPVMERVLVNGTIGNPVTTIEIETITGSFGWMEAWESIQNVSITKGEAIRGISAGYWSGNEAPTGSIINSTFEARNVVGNVYAWHGSIDAVIDATEGDVRHVKAEGEIAGSIAAADSITAVESELGSITATLTADQHHISRVRAGDDLTGAITATLGSVGSVVAGTESFGEITGAVQADQNIFSVSTYDEGLNLFDDDSGVYTLWTGVSLVPLLPALVSADVSGTVTATQGSIGVVRSARNLSGKVTAGKSIRLVSTLGDITDEVTASSGSAIVESLGDITAKIETTSHLQVNVGGSVTSDLKATTGQIAATIGGDLTGTAKSTFGDVLVTVAGDIRAATSATGPVTSSPTTKTSYGAPGSPLVLPPAPPHQIESQFGNALVEARGSIDSSIKGARSSFVSATNIVNATRIDSNGRAVITAAEDAHVEAEAIQGATVVAVGAVKGRILSIDGEIEVHKADKIHDAIFEAENSIALRVRESIEGAYTSRLFHVYVETEFLDAYLAAPGPTGTVGGVVFGNADVEVIAKKEADFWVQGTLAGEISTTEGAIRVTALDHVSADLTAASPEPNEANIGLSLWNGLSGDVTAGASVNGFIKEDLQASSTSSALTADEFINLTVWGDIDRKVTAGGNAAIFAFGDVKEDVAGGGNVGVIAKGNVEGNIDAGLTSSGGSATVIAIGNVTGNVVVAGDASVESLKSISGDVISLGGGNAIVTAVDDITAAGTLFVWGNSAKVSAGGSILGVDIDVDELASVTAHESVDNVNVTGEFIAVSGDASVSSSVFDASAFGFSRVIVASVGQPNVPEDSAPLLIPGVIDSVTVIAQDGVDLISGSSVDSSTISYGGIVNVSAESDVEGDYFASEGIHVVAGGDVNTSQIWTFEKASVLSSGSVSGLVIGGRGVDVTSLDDIDAVIRSSGGPSYVFAGGDLLAPGNVEALRDVVVTAGGSINGTVKSTSTHVTVTAGVAGGAGHVTADVEAHRNASVTALGGEIDGKVKATKGSLRAKARTHVKKELTAAQDILAIGIEGISLPTTPSPQDISAGGNAYVLSYGDINAPVDATGTAIVIAGGGISGAVDGIFGALAVARGGSIADTVNSSVGTASATATENIEKPVTGAQHAVAVALGGVLKEVTAVDGHALVMAGTGNVAEDVSAGLSATVIAGGDVIGEVTAGSSALVSTFGGTADEITAGAHAIISAGEFVSANVQANGTAIVSAFEGVTANVTATNGNALVTTWGNVDGNVSSGKHTLIFAGGSIDSTATAPEDLLVIAHGNAKNVFTAGRDVFILSGGELLGVATAGRDLVGIGFGQHNITMNAGRNAFALAGDTANVAVTAADNAFFIGLGTISGAIMSGGEAATLYAVDSILGPAIINSSGYAGAITWGSAGPANLMSVTGTEGAFGWAYGTVGATINSPSGYASLTTMSDAWTSSVTAGRDASLFTVGDAQLTTVSAGQFASAVALGGFDGSVTAGADGVILSEGGSNAVLSAGKDAFVLSYGVNTGGYSSGRDITVISYSDINAGIVGGRDVELVLAGGDIRGSIVATREFGGLNAYSDSFDAPADSVFAYGMIDANIAATNTLGAPSGGYLPSVGAVGPIQGSIFAAGQLDSITSGGLVTAVVTAPNSYSVGESDSQLQSLTAPEVPDSVVPSILSDADFELSKVLADRAQLLAEFDEFLAEGARARNDAAAAISDAETHQLTRIVDTLAAVARSVESGKNWQLLRFADQQFREERSLDRVTTAVNELVAFVHQRIEKARKSRHDKYARIAADIATFPDEFQSLDDKMEATYQSRKDAAEAIKTYWNLLLDGEDEKAVEHFESIADELNEAELALIGSLSTNDPPPPYVPPPDPRFERRRSKLVADVLNELHLDGDKYLKNKLDSAEWAYQGVAILGDMLGPFGDLQTVMTGKDLAGNEVSGWGKAFAGLGLLAGVLGGVTKQLDGLHELGNVTTNLNRASRASNKVGDGRSIARIVDKVEDATGAVDRAADTKKANKTIKNIDCRCFTSDTLVAVFKEQSQSQSWLQTAQTAILVGVGVIAFLEWRARQTQNSSPPNQLQPADCDHIWMIPEEESERQEHILSDLMFSQMN